MESNNSEHAFKYDTILKSIFGKAAALILGSPELSVNPNEKINVELASLGQKLIPDFICSGLLKSLSPHEPCLIHIEFQRHNDPSKVFRMGEYFFRIQRKLNTQNYNILQFFCRVVNRSPWKINFTESLLSQRCPIHSK